VYMSGLVSELFGFLARRQRRHSAGGDRENAESVSAGIHMKIQSQYTLACFKYTDMAMP
jgi:hypothetical protein